MAHLIAQGVPMDKKIYKIPCTWEMYGIIEVEASNLKKAIQLADEAPLPGGDYVDSSWQVTPDTLPEWNQLNEADEKFYNTLEGE